MKLITKRIRVGIGLAFLIESPSCSCTQESSEIDQIKLPNIILLMGDDHGWDEVGYNGHPFVKTPVLDEMATNGLRFERFYAAHPTSSPTRASFLTGRPQDGRYGPKKLQLQISRVTRAIHLLILVNGTLAQLERNLQQTQVPWVLMNGYRMITFLK